MNVFTVVHGRRTMRRFVRTLAVTMAVAPVLVVSYDPASHQEMTEVVDHTLNLYKVVTEAPDIELLYDYLPALQNVEPDPIELADGV